VNAANHLLLRAFASTHNGLTCAGPCLYSQGHGKGVDWWTLGILIFEMLAGQPPFVDDDPMGIYQQILSGKISFPRYFDRNAKSLIKKLLTADLTKRYGVLKLGAEDVKKHKWLATVDYNALYARSLTAPIVPKYVRARACNPHWR
jgi:protein kinase A